MNMLYPMKAPKNEYKYKFVLQKPTVVKKHVYLHPNF